MSNRDYEIPVLNVGLMREIMEDIASSSKFATAWKVAARPEIWHLHYMELAGLVRRTCCSAFCLT